MRHCVRTAESSEPRAPNPKSAPRLAVAPPPRANATPNVRTYDDDDTFACRGTARTTRTKMPAKGTKKEGRLAKENAVEKRRRCTRGYGKKARRHTLCSLLCVDLRARWLVARAYSGALYRSSIPPCVSRRHTQPDTEGKRESHYATSGHCKSPVRGASPRRMCAPSLENKGGTFFRNIFSLSLSLVPRQRPSKPAANGRVSLILETRANLATLCLTKKKCKSGKDVSLPFWSPQRLAGSLRCKCCASTQLSLFAGNAVS